MFKENPFKGNPEEKAIRSQEAGLGKFEDRVRDILLEPSGIKRFMKDQTLMDYLKERGWPEDMDTCEEIAEKKGMGATEVAAISRYQREHKDTLH